MRDLEIRGAGNLLGTQQSGHIATVGYKLRCWLLETTVRNLKQMPRAKRQVDDLAAELPDRFGPLPDEARRPVTRPPAACPPVTASGRLPMFPFGQRRDGGPELVIRRKHAVIPVPVPPWRRHEVGEPVEKLKRREVDDAAALARERHHKPLAAARAEGTVRCPVAKRGRLQVRPTHIGEKPVTPDSRRLSLCSSKKKAF